VSVALFPVSGLEALIDWIYAGVPVRFPQLKIALCEAGVSWVPMALDRLRRAYDHDVGRDWPQGSPPPEELVHRNFFFCSIEDPSAFRLLDLIGEDNVMVETDFPSSTPPGRYAKRWSASSSTRSRRPWSARSATPTPRVCTACPSPRTTWWLAPKSGTPEVHGRKRG
jgi:hypothetical protein